MRLVASERLIVLDELRVPYEQVGFDTATGDEADPFPLSGFAVLRQSDRPEAPHLRWPSTTTHLAGEPRLYSFAGTPFFARLVPDPVLRELAAQHEWVAGARVHDAADRVVGAVWRERDGGVVVPFDLNEAILNLTMRPVEAEGPAVRSCAPTTCSGRCCRGAFSSPCGAPSAASRGAGNFLDGRSSPHAMTWRGRSMDISQPSRTSPHRGLPSGHGRTPGPSC